MHSCSCCSSHAEFWPETKQGRNQKALNPKTEIETTARNSTERNETILATQSSRKADREYSSIFKFYGTNKQRQNRRSKRGADAGRGGVALTHTILFGKLNATWLKVCSPKWHMTSFILGFSFSFIFGFQLQLCLQFVGLISEGGVARKWACACGDLVFRWGKARLIIQLKAISFIPIINPGDQLLFSSLQ